MKKNTYFAIFLILFNILSRLIPHPPNFTPLISLSLFAAVQLPHKTAVFIVLISLLLSDFSLHFLHGYPLIGSWMIFTYSGLALITVLGAQLMTSLSWKTLIYFVVTCSLSYWLWTNFGVWLLSNIYIKSLPGLVSCYLAALPFLGNQLLGDLIWMVVVFGSYKAYALCNYAFRR